MDVLFGSNLRFLRNRKGLSQEQLAQEFGVTRSKLNSYENSVALNPPIDLIIQVSRYFEVPVEPLLLSDLSESEFKLRGLMEEYISGSKLRVLATTLDANNKENIELVPLRVKAGYATGFNDPEFIGSLPTFQLPFLARERKYRAFQIDGDSMLPIKHGSYVVAEYVSNWHEIKSGDAYVVVTQHEGAVFKVVKNFLSTKRSLELHSLNPEFKPYEVPVSEISEVWKFINYFSHELPEPLSTNEQILQRLTAVESRLGSLK
ncbi:MAG: LexA family transcriptional regulator [Bacteroidetes bacterium]|nr:LexA family transcriptional regulator [Bacteroidota bacterium]MCK6611798.1 LexA family transcriptional regulator [Bacteroidia bacterium]